MIVAGSVAYRGYLAPVAVLLALGLLAACEKEDILPGERFDVRTPLAETVADDATASDTTEAARSVPLRLPQARSVTSWTHRNGDTGHRLPPLILSAAPELQWQANIGSGNDRKHRITADPIVAEGRIFTMDSRARVSAVSPGGEVLWTRDLTPASDRTDDASGGGLAYGGGTLFASTGFGELSAINPETGAVSWTQDIEAPAAAAPVVIGKFVYVIGRDNRAWAIDRSNGRVKWQQRSGAEQAVFNGGAAPAEAGRFVILPFSSGEIAAVLKGSGIRIWQATVSGVRPGQARAIVGDITSDPVVDGGRIYAGNQSGRLVAIKRLNGERLWTARFGALSPVWPEGGSVFVVTDENQLMRLDARDGSEIWSVDLPKWHTENTRRRRDVFAHYGPIIAGGRLLVASSDNKIRVFDPASGAELDSIDLPGGASSHMAVVGGTLYVINARGALLAYR